MLKQIPTTFGGHNIHQIDLLVTAMESHKPSVKISPGIVAAEIVSDDGNAQPLEVVEIYQENMDSKVDTVDGRNADKPPGIYKTL